MKREDTRSRILQASVQTLAARGFAATTARTIAATGGFAPGVIYYHFADLDELFVATARFTSEARLARYRDELGGLTSAVEVVRRLRVLYDEDTTGGHIAAVQELLAAAGRSEGLAEEMRSSTAVWQDFTADMLTRMLRGVPFARLIPVREAATAVVASSMGLEMLTHLQANLSPPEKMFDSAHRVAVVVDKLRLKRPRRSKA